SIVELVAWHLKRAGYEVETAADGEEADRIVRRGGVDLVVLDVMLPGMDGLSLCRQWRGDGIEVPVIFLTARDDEVDRVLGLDLGGDDYVVKPFLPRELVSRVKAVLRRMRGSKANGEDRPVIRVGDLTIWPQEHRVEVGGRPVQLTAREFALLTVMASKPGRVWTRDELLDRVWGYTYAGDSRIVDVMVSHLRDKIEKDPKKPRYITTVRGVGYGFGGNQEWGDR
ncbi:MAG: response regulator transcription factor, partial [Alicyclobacillaceae bacterium]|nr:response regulator transcription factor [Alicyclobacillaceae bacterium]